MSNKNECYLIQNYQLLLDQIPDGLKNLSYGIYSDNALYNNLRFIYNKRFNYFPIAIFYVKNESDIIYLIKNFVEYNLKFSIRCGGHAYEPASLSENYIIDVKNISYIKINKKDKTVRIGSGVKLGDLITAISKENLITVTGESSCVGISGLTLAGGKGPLTRMYGMACDNIIEVKLVNYEGNTITANKKVNSDLFWALKGAGICNFGIIIEIKMKLYEDIYCKISTLTWNWEPAKVKEVLLLYNNVFINLSKEITTDVNITYNNGTASFFIKFYIFGNNEFDELVKFKDLHSPTITNCSGFFSQITNCWVSYDTGKALPFSKMKSTMIFYTINTKTFEIYINSINKLLELNYNLSFQYNFTQLGGQVIKGNSCYFPKKASTTLTILMSWTYENLNSFSLNFINKVYKKIIKYTSKYLFPNMIDYDIKNYMDAYYGKNKKQLIKIKNKYDPDNIFNWRQSIPNNIIV